MDLLAQAKHVTRDLPVELVEKLVVPTERKLRSHGRNHNVVEVKVMYPGYVFCKMRICAETYEPLQQLPLCRSWMAGTVNQKGYKKLPPAPIALSDDEVAKFKGLEERTDAMYEQFGEDYTGRGDDGMDLIEEQFKGYRVDNYVKILSGNFKGEDGVVRRIKDGEIMVRLYTYGNILDQWFKPDEIRPMTDAEAMKGLTGPTGPVNQDEFDVSIGKKPRERTMRGGGGGMRSDQLGGGGAGGGRNRRQDRIARGERGRDIFGRTEQEMKEEEENWRQFREEQRASQQQKRGDMWGIKERTSWDNGDDAAQFDDGKWKSGRQVRRERKASASASGGKNNEELQSFEDAIDGSDDWDLFADPSSAVDVDDDSSGDGAGEEEDDFFNSLMSELSDSLESTSSDANTSNSASSTGSSSSSSSSKKETFNSNSNSGGSKHKSSSSNDNDEDDFFTDLMSQLSETVDETPSSPSSHGHHDGSKHSEASQNTMKSAFSDDDFFASLEADLNQSLNMDDDNGNGNGNDNDSDDEDYNSFAKPSSSSSSKQDALDEDNFFASLESQLGEALTEDKPSGGGDSVGSGQKVAGADEDDFFASLESQLGEALTEDKPATSSTEKKVAVKASSAPSLDLSKQTVASLKDMLRERGLKVSGKKSELIQRLKENQEA